MPEFLVELYVASDDSSAAHLHADLTREGQAVRCVRSILVPQDETCFLLVEAPSAQAVEEAVRRAGLRHEHISAASSSIPPTTKGTTVTITTSNTSTSSSTDYSELRDKQQKVWSSGDYNKIAAITVPLSEHLVDHVGVGQGDRVLDVATGTGHAALAAARRSAVVTGIDYVPELLDIARRRAAAEDLQIDFAQADAENLPFADASFDFVLSAIGVMFAADHAQAASELVRVTRAGGRIGVVSWTPEGFIGGLLATVGKHVTPPAGAQPPTRWGVEAVVAELFGDEVVEVASTTDVVTQRFTDADAFADLFITYYGPTYSAANRLDEEGRAAFRADLIALASSFDRSQGDGLVVDWEYRIVTGVRR